MQLTDAPEHRPSYVHFAAFKKENAAILTSFAAGGIECTFGFPISSIGPQLTRAIDAALTAGLFNATLCAQ